MNTTALACCSSPMHKDRTLQNDTCFSSAAPIDTKNRKLKVTVVKNFAESTKRRIDSTLFATVWIINRNMRNNGTAMIPVQEFANHQKSNEQINSIAFTK